MYIKHIILSLNTMVSRNFSCNHTLLHLTQQDMTRNKHILFVPKRYQSIMHIKSIILSLNTMVSRNLSCNYPLLHLTHQDMTRNKHVLFVSKRYQSIMYIKSIILSLNAMVYCNFSCNYPLLHQHISCCGFTEKLSIHYVHQKYNFVFKCNGIL